MIDKRAVFREKFEKLCRKYHIASDLIDFEAEIDDELSFYENLDALKDRMASLMAEENRYDFLGEIDEGQQERALEQSIWEFRQVNPEIKKTVFKKKWDMQLNPLKKLLAAKEILTFDIETKEGTWDKFAFCGVYDGEEYMRFDSMDGAIRELFSHNNRGKLMFAHNMGKFDGMFIMDALAFRRPEYEILPIINGGRMLEIKVRDKSRNTWHLRDSYCLMPSSLKKLTHNFGVEHKKLEETVKGMTENPEYNRNDCIGLYEVLKKFMEYNNGYLGMTISQTALTDFRKNYQDRPIRCVREYEEELRAAYYGGRVEIFKFNFDMDKKFYNYDVNSLYPAMLRENSYPYGDFRYCHSDIDKEGFSLVRAEEFNFYPVLPQRVGHKMMFMTGKKEGWYSNQELRWLENMSHYETEVLKTIACDDCGPIFRDFVDGLYAQRLEARAAGNEALAYVLKLKLNSFYGKLGQKREKDRIVINPEYIEEGMKAEDLGDGRLVFKTQSVSDSPHIIPSIPAMVTANARLFMLKKMFPLRQETIYYMDTDSVILSEPSFKASDRLGDFKLECEMDRFMTLLPKVYTYRDTGADRTIMKMKGVSIVTAGDFAGYVSGEDIVNDRGVQGFKSAVVWSRAHPLSDGLLFPKHTTKSMKSYYDKRRIEKGDDLDWRTAPFRVGDDRTVNEKSFAELRAVAVSKLRA
jgi:hypothetical protein